MVSPKKWFFGPLFFSGFVTSHASILQARALPRLAVWMVLQAKEGCFTALFALVCSSWVSINHYSSGRSVIYATGYVLRTRVQQANCMASRMLDWTLDMPYLFLIYLLFFVSKGNIVFFGTKRANNVRMVCLISLCIARGGTYIVEQPGSSVLREYHRFDWLCETTREPWQQFWTRGLSTIVDGQGSEWWKRDIYSYISILYISRIGPLKMCHEIHLKPLWCKKSYAQWNLNFLGLKLYGE